MRKKQKKVSNSLGKNREKSLRSADVRGLVQAFYYDTIIHFGGSCKHTVERYCYLFGLSVACVCIFFLVVWAAICKFELVQDKGWIEKDTKWVIATTLNRQHMTTL